MVPDLTELKFPWGQEKRQASGSGHGSDKHYDKEAVEWKSEGQPPSKWGEECRRSATLPTARSP